MAMVKCGLETAIHLQSCVESDQLELSPRKVYLVIACCTRFRENEGFVENFEKNAKKDNSF